MNKKARERAKRLGISYSQALNMYKPAKPVLPDQELAWNRLNRYAHELGMDITSEEQSFCIMGHGIAISFPSDATGIEQAIDWFTEFEMNHFKMSRLERVERRFILGR